MKQFIFFLIILISKSVSAQKGSVNGLVIDDKTGETLVGVTVSIAETTTGTATNMDGVFNLELEKGTYTINFSSISYEPHSISPIKVIPGKTTEIQTIRMKENNLEIAEVIVSAEAKRTTEAALNLIKKQSAVIMDGITSSQIQLLGDKNAIEAAKRITGVTIEENKYIYVRGLGDRYSKTTLNGMEVPGLDPDRNSLQLDIFPASVIDNLIVSKNFTADQPADFSGGLMNMELKDFPESKLLSISAGTSYNPNMHFNSGFLTYKGSKTDFLGFDNGMRSLPDQANHSNIPTPISGASQEEINDFVKGFNPQLAALRQQSLANYSFSLSAGNKFNLPGMREKQLGYILSLSYRMNYNYYDDVVLGEYQRHHNPEIYEMQNAHLQVGELGETSVLAGIYGGIGLKTQKTRIRLTGLRLQNGESRAGKFALSNNGEAVGQSGYYATSDNLEYNQRSITNLLLHGTHISPLKGWDLEYRLSPTLSTTEDPDIRRTAFTHTAGRSSFMAGAGGNPVRIWRNLEELNLSARLDFTKKYNLNQSPARFKTGISYTYKERDYNIMHFDMQFFGNQYWPDPNPGSVLNPENIFPNSPNSIYYQSGNADPNPNKYNSNVNLVAAYVSNDFSLIDRLRTIIGLRIENFVLHHTGRDQRYASGDIRNGRNLENEKVLETMNFFPSLNLIYELSSDQNLRFSYSKTIARPSFKELSYAQIIDPVTNRIFNGSLFTYPGWDGQLSESVITNTDMRWEIFPGGRQIISVSAFYKNFQNPIELVRIPEQQTSTEYQPRNVGNGNLIGLELEISKSLNFVSPLLRNFNLNSNFTLAESWIDMTESEFNSRNNFRKAGETIHTTRKMAGQSPYALNAGLTFQSNNADYKAGLFYNVQGKTLTIVGAGLFPDVYTEPYHNLSLSISMKIGRTRRSSIDLNISNLLNSNIESTYHAYNAESKAYSRKNPGKSFGVAFNYKF